MLQIKSNCKFNNNLKSVCSFFSRSKFKEKPNPRNTIEMLLSKVFDNRLFFGGLLIFAQCYDGWIDGSIGTYVHLNFGIKENLGLCQYTL